MIKEYLKYRRSIFFFYFSMLLVFPLLQHLFGYPMISVIYGCLIMTYLLVLWVLVDYSRYKKKRKALADIKQHLSTDRPTFPEAENIIIEEYQDWISALYTEIERYIELLEQHHTEQVEYYTMWVHQIKTPISAMRLILQGKDQATGNELLEQELFKIEQYVELALQYTKLKSLSSDLVIREYMLEEILNQSIKKYASLFIYKRLSLQLEEFHATITTDSKWCSFLIEQLLSNALKYTQKGGITITFKDNKLTLSDTGIGIRKEDIDRIFEKGYTGYNGRVDKKASGIGLYLSKKVAEALAIKLHISSKVGEGTQVTIVFPEAGNWYYHKSETGFHAS